MSGFGLNGLIGSAKKAEGSMFSGVMAETGESSSAISLPEDMAIELDGLTAFTPEQDVKQATKRKKKHGIVANTQKVDDDYGGYGNLGASHEGRDREDAQNNGVVGRGRRIPRRNGSGGSGGGGRGGSGQSGLSGGDNGGVRWNRTNAGERAEKERPKDRRAEERNARTERRYGRK